MKNKEQLQEQISSIRFKIRSGEYRFTLHSLERQIERSINTNEIEEAILNGEVIEDYPEDKYGPSCLISGLTINGRSIPWSNVPCLLYG